MRKKKYKQLSRSIGARKRSLTPAKKESLRRANARKAEIREERLKQLNPPDQCDQLPRRRKSSLLESHPVVKRSTGFSCDEAGTSTAPITASQLFFLQKRKEENNKDLFQELGMDGDEDVKPEIKEEPEEEEDAFEDEEFMEADVEDQEEDEEPLSALPLAAVKKRNAVKIGLTMPIRLKGQPKRSSVTIQRNPNVSPQTPSESRFCLLCYYRCNNAHFRQTSTPIVEESPKEADFRVMFVLKKMLNVPNEHLAKYLKKFGGVGGIPPRNWITFCNFCQATINKALLVQKKIIQLEKDLKHLQAEMIERIKTTQKIKTMDHIQSLDDVLRVTNETRSYVVTGKFRRQVLTPMRPASPPPPPSPSDPLALDIDNDVKIEDEKGDVLELDVREKVKPSTAPKLPADNITTKADRVALKKNRYRCPLCPHISYDMNFNLFCSHLLFHYRRPYKCSQCNSHFASDSALEFNNYPINSIQKDTDSDSHVCSSGSLTHLDTKREFYKLLIWGCNYCDAKFNSDSERELHEGNCLKNKSSARIKLTKSCNLCQKRFRNVVEWRLHTILEHPEVAKYGCNYCKETFSVKTKEGIDILDDNKLKEHQLQCHRLNAIPNTTQTLVQTGVRICDFCGETFWSSRISLHGHMEAIHKIPKNKALSCDICHHRVASRRRLLLHCQTNHFLERTKLFVCEICGYENIREKCFDHHKFKEHGIVPLERPLLSCPEDGCAFKTVMSQQFKLHKMREHNAARQFKCETCGKEFLKKDQLNRHSEIHLNKNLKPFQCEICGNSFAVRNYLYIHMRLSHQNRPFASTHKRKPPRKNNAVKTITETGENVNALPPMEPDIINMQHWGPEGDSTGHCNEPPPFNME